jgi:hypothetical protein
MFWPGGRNGVPIDTFASMLPFATGSLAGSKVRTPFGVGPSCRINFPVSRPKSGIALADASDSALVITIAAVKWNIFIKPANTAIPAAAHEKIGG